MQTRLSVFLDEALIREVKAHAAGQGITVSDLVERLLRREVGEGKRRK